MNDSTAFAVMPEAVQPVALPKGWSILRDGDPLTVAAPESDLRISFLGYEPLGPRFAIAE